MNDRIKYALKDGVGIILMIPLGSMVATVVVPLMLTGIVDTVRGIGAQLPVIADTVWEIGLLLYGPFWPLTKVIIAFVLFRAGFHIWASNDYTKEA